MTLYQPAPIIALNNGMNTSPTVIPKYSPSLRAITEYDPQPTLSSDHRSFNSGDNLELGAYGGDSVNNCEQVLPHRFVGTFVCHGARKLHDFFTFFCNQFGEFDQLFLGSRFPVLILATKKKNI
jgi:hypothetical protein